MDPITPQPEQPQYQASIPEPKHFLNKKFIVTFVILLLLGGGAYAGIWWWGNQQTAQEVVPTFTPRPSVATDPTADWKTYRNTQYGFEFKYPSDFVLQSKSFEYYKNVQLADLIPGNRDFLLAILKNTEISVEAGSPAGKADFTLTVIKNTPQYTIDRIVDEERQRLHDMVDQGLAEFKKSDITISSTVVAGYPAKRISVNNLGDSGDTTTVFSKGDYIFEFKTNSFIEGSGNQILSTFQFIDIAPAN